MYLTKVRWQFSVFFDMLDMITKTVYMEIRICGGDTYKCMKKLGLSENVFLNLRMFFIFLGPVYLMVFCKIIGIIKQQTKSERDKPVFVPLAVYLLILESMTLLICIVTFAPLSQTISVAFILTIALTGILIILVPFFFAFTAAYKGDKKTYREQREREKASVLSYLFYVLVFFF